MAINYTFAEVVAVLHTGTDIEAIADIGKRYPLMAYFVNRILAKAGDDFAQFAHAMPEYLTAGKVNGAFKSDKPTEVAEPVEDDAEETEEKPAEPEKADKPKGKRGRPKKVVEPVAVPDPDEDVSADDAGGMPDFEGMGNADLLEFIDKHKARGRMASRKKPDMVELCKTIWAEKNGDSDADSEPVEDDEEKTEPESDQYSGKTAKELYLMAKKRGLKLEQKKNAEFYADALRKADAAESVEDDEDEDWGDDEDETPAPAPAKKEKKAEKKPAKKPVTADDEDEDEWDI